MAVAKGVNPRTFSTYLSQLSDDKIFTKTSIGRFYSEREARELQTLLDFQLPELEKSAV